MILLRAEHGEAIAVLLVLYALQIYMGLENMVKKEVSIWIDNAEVLSRGRRKEVGTSLKDHGVLDLTK